MYSGAGEKICHYLVGTQVGTYHLGPTSPSVLDRTDILVRNGRPGCPGDAHYLGRRKRTSSYWNGINYRCNRKQAPRYKS